MDISVNKKVIYSQFIIGTAVVIGAMIYLNKNSPLKVVDENGAPQDSTVAMPDIVLIGLALTGIFGIVLSSITYGQLSHNQSDARPVQQVRR